MATEIKQLDRTSLRELRYALEENVKGIAEKYGIHVEVGNCRFASTHATFKIEIATKNSNGVVHTKIAEEFLRAAEVLGLKKEDLYREFSFHNETYRLIGYSRRASRYPFIAERIRDKEQAKFTKNTVVSQLT